MGGWADTARSELRGIVCWIVLYGTARRHEGLPVGLMCRPVERCCTLTTALHVHRPARAPHALCTPSVHAQGTGSLVLCPFHPSAVAAALPQPPDALFAGVDNAVLDRIARIMSYVRTTADGKKLKKKDRDAMLVSFFMQYLQLHAVT